MNRSNPQLVWLRRILAGFVSLLSLAVTCGLIAVLLAALGDSIGAKAFRWVTLSVAITVGVCGIALLIATTWNVMRLWEQSPTIDT